MKFGHSFRFANAKLNARLVAALRAADIAHSVGRDGAVHYSADDEGRLENGVLGPIRNGVFPSWQLVCCPPDWAARYERYMTEHEVPCEQQWVDGEPCFLIPRRFRPHTWKLPGERPAKASRRAAMAG